MLSKGATTFLSDAVAAADASFKDRDREGLLVEKLSVSSGASHRRSKIDSLSCRSYLLSSCAGALEAVAHVGALDDAVERRIRDDRRPGGRRPSQF
jgi:hypothetical protein